MTAESDFNTIESFIYPILEAVVTSDKLWNFLVLLINMPFYLTISLCFFSLGEREIPNPWFSFSQG